MERLLALQILLLKLIHDLLRSHFTLLLRDLLDHIRKLLVHTLWQLESVEGIHYKCYAAFPGLAVDADNRLVSLPISEGSMGDREPPSTGFPLMQGLHPLVDSILMRAGKGGKYSFPA